MACEILLKGSFEILKSNFLFLVCLSITGLWLEKPFTVSNNEVLADFLVFCLID